MTTVTYSEVLDFVNSVQTGPRHGGGYVVPEPIAEVLREFHREVRLNFHRRFDVGHEMVLPERAREKRP